MRHLNEATRDRASIHVLRYYILAEGDHSDANQTRQWDVHSITLQSELRCIFHSTALMTHGRGLLAGDPVQVPAKAPLAWQYQMKRQGDPYSL